MCKTVKKQENLWKKQKTKWKREKTVKKEQLEKNLPVFPPTKIFCWIRPWFHTPMHLLSRSFAPYFHLKHLSAESVLYCVHTIALWILNVPFSHFTLLPLLSSHSLFCSYLTHLPWTTRKRHFTGLNSNHVPFLQ